MLEPNKFFKFFSAGWTLLIEEPFMPKYDIFYLNNNLFVLGEQNIHTKDGTYYLLLKCWIYHSHN